MLIGDAFLSIRASQTYTDNVTVSNSLYLRYSVFSF